VQDGWSSSGPPPGGWSEFERVVQRVWGMRYIDDLVLFRQDSNANGEYDDTVDFTRYTLTDHQFSVVAVIDEVAKLVERISYSPYGEAR